MDAENKESCSQRDSAERKGYVRAHRSFNRIWKERDIIPRLRSEVWKSQSRTAEYENLVFLPSQTASSNRQ